MKSEYWDVTDEQVDRLVISASTAGAAGTLRVQVC